MFDLLALALVNLFVGLILYFFFSLRASRSLEESRKNPFTPELEEIIKLAVQYFDSSLETLDRKQKACYQMLRQAEALVKGEPKRKPKPKQKEKASKSRNKVNRGKLREKSAQKKEKRETTKTTARSLSKKPALDYKPEEALARLGLDKVEITPLASDIKDAYLLGASPEHQESLSLSKRKKRNLEEGPLQEKQEEKITQKFAKYLRFWLDSKIEKPFKQASQYDLSEENRSLGQRSRNELPSGPEPQFSTPPLEIQKEEIALPLPEEFSQRVAYIHRLLEQGYTKQEISLRAGLSLAQINLIASLPQVPHSSPSPRRKRLIVE